MGRHNKPLAGGEKTRRAVGERKNKKSVREKGQLILDRQWETRGCKEGA